MRNKDVLKLLGVKVLNSTPIRSDCVEIVGCVNGFFIYPYNNYWVVRGKMPLRYAEDLYKYRDSLSIRVEGGVNSNEPIEWCTSDEYEEFKDKTSEQFDLMKIDEFSNKLRSKKKELLEKSKDSFYISMYHIDDVNGLIKVVETIKDNNIRTEW